MPFMRCWIKNSIDYFTTSNSWQCACIFQSGRHAGDFSTVGWADQGRYSGDKIYPTHRNHQHGRHRNVPQRSCLLPRADQQHTSHNRRYHHSRVSEVESAVCTVKEHAWKLTNIYYRLFKFKIRLHKLLDWMGDGKNKQVLKWGRPKWLLILAPFWRVPPFKQQGKRKPMMQFTVVLANLVRNDSLCQSQMTGQHNRPPLYIELS